MALIALTGPAGPGTLAQDHASAFDEPCRRLERQLEAFAAQHAASLEAMRAAAHNLRREDRRRPNETSPPQAQDFREAWRAGSEERAALHRALAAARRPWEERLARALTRTSNRDTGSSTGSTARARLAAQCLDVLQPMLALDAPDRLLASLLEPRSPVAIALAWGPQAPRRQRFLARAAQELVRYPGRSDVDVLVHVLRWEALFLARLEPGSELLDAVTRDLMVLFTERGPDGFSDAPGNLYAPGRFRDFGFADAFRDDSDQLRHVSWALRMFTLSGGHRAAEDVLLWKERYDVRFGGADLNQADLDLNAALRRLALELLGDGPLGTRRPLSIGDYAERLRAVLTRDSADRRARR